MKESPARILRLSASLNVKVLSTEGVDGVL